MSAQRYVSAETGTYTVVVRYIERMVIRLNSQLYYAACPGGEEAVLKTVALNGVAGSNPVRRAIRQKRI